MQPSVDATPTPSTTSLAVVPETRLAALQPLVDSARGYAARARAPSTLRAYAADWRAFEAWCALHELTSLPATPSVIATYLAALADAGRKALTIKRAMWGIAYGHTSQGHVWPKSHPQIKAVMAGICNCMTAARTQKTPIGVGVLAAMAQGASTRDRALLLLGWHGAFRRAELAALNAEDVTFTAEGAVVRIRRSKTDQEGRGADVGIPHASNKPVCAVAALKAHLHGRKTGPLFATHCSKRMSANSIAERVKVAAARVGLNPKLFAGHSLRSGFATTAAEANKPIDAIMRQGRWQNVQTVMEYIRPATLFTSNAAQGLTDAKEKTP